MKRFRIKRDMLGPKEVTSKLINQIPNKAILALQKAVTGDDAKDGDARRFLMHDSLVRSMLKQNKRIDRITAVSARLAIDSLEKISNSIEILSEDNKRYYVERKESLVKVMPRLELLSFIEHYLNSYVLGYMHERDANNCLLIETDLLLNRIDQAKADMPPADYLFVMNILKASLLEMMHPLICARKFLLFPCTPKNNAYDEIALEAFAAVLSKCGISWDYLGEERIKELMNTVASLGYRDSEVWAFKFLIIRNICGFIQRKYDALQEKVSEEIIENDKSLLSLSNEIYCEARDNCPADDIIPVSNIIGSIPVLLREAEASLYYHMYMC